ncbi:MAG: hypothetical protein IH965_11110 [Gemmatimonadetes bacterium]|nr:hypothetical protein [Gemmatimonadota bacterium]
MIVGAVIGAVAGAAIGYAVAPGANTACLPLEFFCEGEAKLVGVAFGVALGTAAGGLIGKAARGDHWEEVPLDALRVSVASQRNGRFGLGLSLRF